MNLNIARTVIRCVRCVTMMMASSGFAISLAFSQAAPAAVPLQQLLAAHGAWKNPNSIQILGTSTIGAVSTPIKITATKQEEVLTERGANKQVSTTTASFKDDGTKVKWDATPGGFVQLDVTGIFFLSQLADRSLTIAAPRAVPLPGGPAQQIHVNSNRTETHYGRLRVKDEFDLFVGANGLLSGISRSFYPSDPRFRFTVAYMFSDYKDTNGVLLPYRIEAFVRGNKFETIVVDSYQVNVPAAPSLFAPRSVK
jgi:hypothetical protein